MHSIYQRYIRPIIGVTLLSVLLVWVSQEGEIFARVKLYYLIFPLLLSLSSLYLGGVILRRIANAYGKHLPVHSALQICAWGTLGNSLGGLPIGTTLKYVALYKRCGLSIKETSAGLIIFTTAITVFLILVVSLSIWTTDLPLFYKIASVAIFLMTLGTLWSIRLFMRNKSIWVELVEPFFVAKRIVSLLILSAVTAISYILNFFAIGLFMLPGTSPEILLFLSSMGLLAGQASMMQSVGGIQELMFGISTYITGFRLIDGVQIALVSRMVTIIASGTILGAMYLSPAVFLDSHIKNRR